MVPGLLRLGWSRRQPVRFSLEVAQPPTPLKAWLASKARGRTLAEFVPWPVPSRNPGGESAGQHLRRGGGARELGTRRCGPGGAPPGIGADGGSGQPGFVLPDADRYQGAELSGAGPRHFRARNHPETRSGLECVRRDRLSYRAVADKPIKMNSSLLPNWVSAEPGRRTPLASLR